MTEAERNFRVKNLQNQIAYYKRKYSESECREVVEALQKRLRRYNA